MTTIHDRLAAEFDQLRSHIPHHHHYDQPQDQTAPEAPVTLPIITAIEDEARSIGHGISAELHAVLARHLTIGNMAAHVGQWAAATEASPLLQTLERFALGPAGEAAVAKVVEDVAGLLQAQAPVPAPAEAAALADAEPAEVPAA
jgi:hypothetical protein